VSAVLPITLHYRALSFADLPERFSKKVNQFAIAPLHRPELGCCWAWTGTLYLRYGRYWHQGRNVLAYKLAYELLVGEVPDGLVLDHLCRNTLCVNPGHLEPVTQRENIRRGTSPIGQQIDRTHCKNGHEFTPENTSERQGRYGLCRTCRTCARERAERFAAGLLARKSEPMPYSAEAAA
jgi:hypothetical protein